MIFELFKGVKTKQILLFIQLLDKLYLMVSRKRIISNCNNFPIFNPIIQTMQ